ncbi:GNAT family N-acetyltransferase, partial [bacterium]
MTMLAAAPIALRAPSPADAQRLGQIVYDAFVKINDQHNFPPDFPCVEVAVGFLEMMLANPTIEGIVAEQDGKPVGCAFLWPDGPVAGIGPVTVDPSAQDSSVGK